jgi:hypothetical protein
MAIQITLTLPDELYQNAKYWSIMTQRDMAQTLTEALKIVLTPVYTEPRLEKPVASLPNSDVLALSQVRMESNQGERLGELLEKQHETQLTDQEQSELLALMQMYNQLWIRQSEALAEAVRRGLRFPLQS